ncbi:MAG: hypothetical protein IJC83_01200 [Oscillospiraceae bacterium]|nr:hypothetical protein [Oscillospiraceae bacterium]
MNNIPLNTSAPINTNFEKNAKVSAILECALNRLRVKKGSYVLDQSLGSELYKLTGIKGGGLFSRALTYVKEALLHIEEITVLDVLVNPKGDVLNLTIYMEIEDVKTSVTVSV